MLFRKNQVIINICPICENPVLKIRSFFGQSSYDCDTCNGFGPWKSVKKIRKETYKGKFRLTDAELERAARKALKLFNEENKVWLNDFSKY
jgi:epoxyqueuosine reductase QueG